MGVGLVSVGLRFSKSVDVEMLLLSTVVGEKKRRISFVRLFDCSIRARERKLSCFALVLHHLRRIYCFRNASSGLVTRRLCHQARMTVEWG